MTVSFFRKQSIMFLKSTANVISDNIGNKFFITIYEGIAMCKPCT